VIVYRRAIAADLDAIADVHVQVHRETYVPLFGGVEHPATPKADARRAQWAAYLAHDDAFVALANGAVVGIAHAEHSVMTTLYVLAAHHRKGIGGALLRCVQDALAERGIGEMTFNVLAVNVKARAFYEAQGARWIRDEIADEPEGPTKDAVYALSTRR